MTFKILNDLRNELEKRCSKITRKGGEVKISYGEPYVENHRSNGVKHLVEFVDVTVEGSYVVPGWEFVATAEFDEDANANIIRSTPGVEVPSIYFNRCECDHCKINRSRKHTIIIRNIESGEFKQVGKSCMKDYTGYSAEYYAGYVAALSDLQSWADEECERYFGCGRFREYYSVQEILEQTVARVLDRGYITNAVAEKLASERCITVDTTSQDVKLILTGAKDWKGNPILEAYSISDEIRGIVEEIRNLVNQADDTNEFVHNCKTLLSKSHVEFRDIGFVVASYSFYNRMQKEKEAQKNQVTPSEYIGDIGGKIEFTAVPSCVYSYDTQWGVSYIYKFTVDNNVIVWKTSNRLDDCKEVHVKATVKAHEEYRGVKQTEITRARTSVVRKEEVAELVDNKEIEDALDMLYECV